MAMQHCKFIDDDLPIKNADFPQLWSEASPSLDSSREPRETTRGFAETGGASEVSGAGLANQSASDWGATSYGSSASGNATRSCRKAYIQWIKMDVGVRGIGMFMGQMVFFHCLFDWFSIFFLPSKTEGFCTERIVTDFVGSLVPWVWAVNTPHKPWFSKYWTCSYLLTILDRYMYIHIYI